VQNQKVVLDVFPNDRQTDRITHCNLAWHWRNWTRLDARKQKCGVAKDVPFSLVEKECWKDKI